MLHPKQFTGAIEFSVQPGAIALHAKHIDQQNQSTDNEVIEPNSQRILIAVSTPMNH
ncbi:MAG: hypothetical protein AAGD25_26555 [Cyanobacteria bacterium P01_F01_bin.150]